MSEPLIIGRYMICDPIGAGGMATVHLGRILGAAGFSRVVAIKRLHPSCAESDKFATMLIDEARIVARIRHPNVAPTLDVIRAAGELLLIMEYVHGPSLGWLQARLKERNESIPARIAIRIALDMLGGLHAAHQAKSERGRPLGIVHRDVSPQNILIGDDGVSRVLDFGIAKAEGRLSFSMFGEIKGKLRYMSPEQLSGGAVDHRTDIFAAGIVLWEMLAGRRLITQEAGGVPVNVMKDLVSTLGALRGQLTNVTPAAEAVIIKALSADRNARFTSADEMAVALAAVAEAATPKELGAWAAQVAADLLAERLEQLERIEQFSAVGSRALDSPVQVGAALPKTLATGAPPASLPPTLVERLPVGGRSEPEHMVDRTLPLPVGPKQKTLALPPIARPAAAEQASTMVSFHQPSPSNAELPASSPEPTRASRTPWVLLVLGTMLVLGVLGGALGFARARRGVPAAPALPLTTPSTSAAAAASSVAAPLPPASISTTAVVASIETPAPSAAASVARPPPRRSSPSAAPPKPNCDPPFTVDREGVRIAKPECLGN